MELQQIKRDLIQHTLDKPGFRIHKQTGQRDEGRYSIRQRPGVLNRNRAWARLIENQTDGVCAAPYRDVNIFRPGQAANFHTGGHVSDTGCLG